MNKSETIKEIEKLSRQLRKLTLDLDSASPELSMLEDETHQAQVAKIRVRLADADRLMAVLLPPAPPGTKTICPYCKNSLVVTVT